MSPLKFIKRKIGQFAGSQMVEHMETNNNGFLMRRVWQDHLLRYQFTTQFVKEKSVLDIACGDGYGTVMLAESAKSVRGVDLSAEAVELAKKKYTKVTKNIEFVAGEAIAYLEKHKEQYDVIVSFETIEHIQEYEKFVSLLHDRLKPKGILVLSTPEKKFSDFIADGVFNPYHVKEFYYDELMQLCQNIFGTKPEGHFQRPVLKKHFLMSTFNTFIISEKSSIQRADNQHHGMDNILVCRKK